MALVFGVFTSLFSECIASMATAMMIFDGCQLGFKTWIYVRQYEFEENFLCLTNAPFPTSDPASSTDPFYTPSVKTYAFKTVDYLTWVALSCAFFHCCLCFIFNHLKFKMRSRRTDRQSFISDHSVYELRSF